MYNRRPTRVVNIGALPIGGRHPIAIESMTNTPTQNVEATVAQIKALTAQGCEIVRLAVNDARAAAAFGQIRQKAADVPLIADIHFDHRLALAAIEAGADKIRINPGNIGDGDGIKAVADMANKRGIPIRIGVNGGSLEADLLESYGVAAEALAQSALRNIKLLNDFDFDNVVVSIKASDVALTLKAHEIFAPQTDYPLNIGITEAGTLYSGIIKSCAGLAALLTRGIGDTVRISLTSDPVEEVRAAKELLKALGLRSFGPQIVSCPTCGRCQVDLITIANKVEGLIAHIKAPVKVAIMGCAVNGPGEARECDIGIAAGKGEGLLFKKGRVVRKVREKDIIAVLVDEIERIEREGL